MDKPTPQPNLNLHGHKQLYSLGTRYIDRSNRPWVYVKKTNAGHILSSAK